MDRLKNAFYAAGTIGLAAAVAFVALVFIGGALAVAGIVVAALILVGAVMSLFGKKKSFSFGQSDQPLTVVYTRVEEREPRDGSGRR